MLTKLLIATFADVLFKRTFIEQASYAFIEPPDLNSVVNHGDHLSGGRKWNWGQIIKWTVYSLLFVNFFYYAIEEFYISRHTLSLGGSLSDWAREFATTIDELGWFGLLLAFELETYSLSDESFEKKKVRWTIRVVRLICYVMLAHTLVARLTTVNDFMAVNQAVEINNICQVADQGISYDFSYEYTDVTADNCAEITTDTVFYFTEPTVIVDSAGYELFKKLVYVDLIDVIAWLLVVWSIELTVWIQNRDIADGRLMLVTHGAKVLYLVLWADAIWWVSVGHWVWSWDQALWIIGFWAIEKNLSDWRDDIREEEFEEQLEKF
ncbi:MAG: hypothetical protein ACI9H8_001076 [Lysobacterales bacterium]